MYLLKLSKVLLFIAVSLMMAMNTYAQETRTFIDYYGEVDIPVKPQRIVSLQDHNLTMTLVELDAPVAGSAGRVANDGSFYLRGIKDLLGVDFNNSNIEYVGSGTIDLEKVLAVNPDLIITDHWEEESELEKLRKIAPTVVIDQSKPLLDFMKDTADAGGVLEAYQERLIRYQARLAEAKKIIPNAADISVSIVISSNGVLRGWNNYGALTQVMNDIGFQRPNAVKSFQDWAEFSPEAMQQLDADFIIDTYRISIGDTPAQARKRMSEVLPDWCSVWHACRHNQYLIFPRTFVFSSSFTSLELATQLLVTHIGGREFVPISE